MTKLDIKYIFKNALDTFKVFETIPIEISGILVEGHATTIWQILNHLIIWRKYQIEKLVNIKSEVIFNETASWIPEKRPQNIEAWNSAISEFEQQTAAIEKATCSLSVLDPELNEKLRLLQDSSTHLSFHLGEIILIARQKNKYPKPSEMNDFLN